MITIEQILIDLEEKFGSEFKEKFMDVTQSMNEEEVRNHYDILMGFK